MWATIINFIKFGANICHKHVGVYETILVNSIVEIWRKGILVVATLTLGSPPRQGLTRMRNKKEAREAHFILSGVQESVKKWTLTLPSELPLWELESQWTPESLGNDWTKCHLDVDLVERHKIYYKGKVVASPKSRPWWILLVWVCLWLVLAPKVLQLCINQLIVWFCASPTNEWLLIILPSPILELQHTPLPPKCYKPRSVPQLLTFSLFSFHTHIWIYQGAWERIISLQGKFTKVNPSHKYFNVKMEVCLCIIYIH